MNSVDGRKDAYAASDDVLRALLRRVLLAGALYWAVPSSAQAQVAFDSVAALPTPPPTRRIAYGPGTLQFGNLRLPKGGGPHPVILFIHGGCYLSQYSISHAGALEQALADSGYAVWSVEYRRVGDEGGGWPGTFQDVGHAADHLRVLAGKYPLDLGRVVAAGHSAGANFALWLTARDRIRSESPLRVENPLHVGAVLGLTPAPDLAALHAKGVCGNVIDKLMGGSPGQVAERYRDVSPAMMVPIGVPQVLIVGAKDASWGPHGRAYHKLAVAASDTLARLVEAPASGHFDVLAPTTTTWAVVMTSVRELFARLK
jgi:acetyl esterase/lipase